MKRLNSKTIVPALLVACMLIWIVNISRANAADVFVVADEFVEGQGISLNAGGACYIVTAFHVVEKAAKITLVAPDRYETEAYLSEGFGGDIDVALLSVGGDADRICTGRKWTAPRELSNQLEKELSGTLRVRRPEGSRRLLRVDITGYDEERFIMVRPKQASDQISEGMSGALLTVGGVDAGMLLEVEGGEGRVLRQDYLYRLINKKLQQQLDERLKINVSTVFPGLRRISVGKTVQLKTRIEDMAGKRIKGRSVTWSSSNPSVVEVSPSGLVRGLSPGSTTVTAAVDEWTGTIVIEVQHGQIIVNVSANPSSPAARQPVQLVVTALSEINRPVAGANVVIQTATGGVFQETGSGTMATGATDQSGIFRATWVFQGSSSAIWQQSFFVHVTKSGYMTGEGATIAFVRPY